MEDGDIDDSFPLSGSDFRHFLRSLASSPRWSEVFCLLARFHRALLHHVIIALALVPHQLLHCHASAPKKLPTLPLCHPHPHSSPPLHPPTSSQLALAFAFPLALALTRPSPTSSPTYSWRRNMQCTVQILLGCDCLFGQSPSVWALLVIVGCCLVIRKPLEVARAGAAAFLYPGADILRILSISFGGLLETTMCMCLRMRYLRSTKS